MVLQSSSSTTMKYTKYPPFSGQNCLSAGQFSKQKGDLSNRRRAEVIFEAVMLSPTQRKVWYPHCNV